MHMTGQLMKKANNKQAILKSAIVASAIGILAIANQAPAAALTWNPAMNAAGGSDGAGAWGGSTTNWYNGTAAAAWASGSDAVFGTNSAGGTVTLSAAQNVNKMTFAQSGYVLTGGSVVFGFDSGSNNYSNGAALTVANGVSAELASGFQGGYELFVVGTTSAGSASSLTLSGGTSGTMTSLGLGGYGSVNINGGTYNMSVLQSTATNVTQRAATITTGTFIMGPSAPTSSGTTSYTMDSASAALTVATGDMQIARNGRTATFNLKQGNLAVNTGNLYLISSDYTSTATFNMEGGTANIVGSVIINNSGGGTANNKTAKLLISGGTMSVKGIRFGNNSTATFTTGSAGLLTLSNGSLYVGSGGIYEGTNHPVSDIVTLSGGTLGANADWSSSLAMTLATTNGNIKIKTANASGTAYNITLSGVLSGAGGLTKTGDGVLNLTGANTFAGETVISEGTLLLGAANTIADATGTVTLGGGRLESSAAATIGGHLVVSSGTLSIGQDAGAAALTIAAGKNVTISGGTLALTIVGSSQYDTISGSGVLSITGGVVDLLGAGIDYSQTYQVFSGFSGISVSGLSFTNYDSEHYVANIGTDGVLSFTTVAVPEVASLGVLAAGAMCMMMRRRD